MTAVGGPCGRVSGRIVFPGLDAVGSPIKAPAKSRQGARIAFLLLAPLELQDE